MSDKTVGLNKHLSTKNACIYGNGVLKLRKWILWSIDGVSEVTTNGGLFRRPTVLKMRVGDERLQLNATFDRQAIKAQVEGMHGWVNRFHEVSPLMNLDEFHQFLDQINQIYGVQVDSEFNFESPIWKVLQDVAERVDGTIFVHNSFITCDGRVLFGYLAELVKEIRSEGKT
jgi:hypothetical protein